MLRPMYPRGPIGPTPIMRTALGGDVLASISAYDIDELLRITDCLLRALHRGSATQPLIVERRSGERWEAILRLAYCDECSGYRNIQHWHGPSAPEPLMMWRPVRMRASTSRLRVKEAVRTFINDLKWAYFFVYMCLLTPQPRANRASDGRECGGGGAS